MRGDGCIVLYGDMLDWPCGPGLCSTELTLPGPGDCDISCGLGECNGLRPGCIMAGLLRGDCTVADMESDCCDDDGDGDMSGDCGAIWCCSECCDEDDGEATEPEVANEGEIILTEDEDGCALLVAGVGECLALYSCMTTPCWRACLREASSCFWTADCWAETRARSAESVCVRSLPALTRTRFLLLSDLRVLRSLSTSVS